MKARWLVAAGMASWTVVAGCATEPGVATESARRIEIVAAPTTTEPAAPPATDPPSTDPPATEPPATEPTDPPVATAPDDPGDPGGTTPTTVPPSGDLIDVGDAKSPREYDDFVRAALIDIQAWWGEQYPEIYGAPFQPLAGGVYVAYPERTTPIPGCETGAPTTYEEIKLYSAFYCMQGDFMVYDDGQDGVLYGLAEEFGPSILGVVLAHEFGHAIQARSGVLSKTLPTITTEQQADCFAGAWVARAAAGEAPGIDFTDADVRTGLIAMIAVRDPKGVDQLDPGGHGSAFDRVGAFQVGFSEGAGRCAELIEAPLPLVPNTFRQGDSIDGNSPFGYDEGDGVTPPDIVPIITADLNVYWPQLLASLNITLPQLTVVPVQSAGEIACADPAGDFTTGAIYCAATGEVFFDDALARDLYTRFGDFVVGYIIGGAWSEAVQQALGSPLSGEDRALVDDCLTGAWVGTILPDANDDTARQARIEPGDLDEAIQTALVVGDPASTDDVLGSGFEKIASFRQGVLEGIDACTARIGE
ncbi:MAG: neutral zinc metallopeptidase [Ilumatobacteraceae bacterium]